MRLPTVEREEVTLQVCGTCPWLKSNQGRRHASGWYSKKNLFRLWNALRRGDAPGIVCHSTDPDNGEYGGNGKVKPDCQKRPCAGAVIQVMKHCNAASVAGDYSRYKASHPLPLTRKGLAEWIGRYLFGQLPQVEDRAEDIGLKWLDMEEGCTSRT